MKFRTEYIAPKASFCLDPKKPVVLAGSCFSQNIARKMNDCQWEAVIPCGTLYNPYSIFFALDYMNDRQKGLQRFEKKLFQADGIWHSHMFDSSFSSSKREDCLEEFQIRQEIFQNKLKEGKTLIITLGTSISYFHSEGEFIVGNCHKQPSENYYSQRLSPSEILSCWMAVHEALLKACPQLKTIFTVSPVRHLKDGFIGNARSKAVLLLAVEEILKYSENCYYFPAFEIYNDDLRDYRFYASDLLHPSEEGIEYVWEKFRETFLNEEGNALLDSGFKAHRSRKHRPLSGALGKPLT